ncbi:hypothetical protein ACTMTI_35075 [Nonomuraea sp. H19]
MTALPAIGDPHIGYAENRRIVKDFRPRPTPPGRLRHILPVP